MSPQFSRMVLFKKSINEECQFIIFTSLKMDLNTYICGSTTPTEPFSSDQPTTVCITEILDRIGLLC